MTGEDKMLMFRNRLSKVFRHRSKTARRENISCYRVYDHDLNEFPFSIDLYDQHAYVAEYKRRHNLSDEAHAQWLEESMGVIAELLHIQPENIFTKTRQRKPGRQGQYQKDNNTQSEFIVTENGLKFIINLSDYVDTGLFLDHRITRQRVMKDSQGKKVLNLFAYTGSFSVYAAAGAAQQVTTVDLSRTYLNWAERNMQLNGFTDKNYNFVQADVLQLLKSHPTGNYDLIVMDPPTFSNSKRMEDYLDIQLHHASLINDGLQILNPGSVLYFSTNYTKFQLDKEHIQSSLIEDITQATTPFDFSGKLKRYCFKICAGK